MSILCVGGAGYLGSCVVRLLGEQGANVIVLDDLLYTPRYFERNDVRFVRGRVEGVDLDAIVKTYHVDGVVWLAAIVGDAACMIDPATSLRVNTEAVRWLSRFEGRVVFPSTCSVYGAQDALADEDSPLNPLSLYAMTKIAAEKHLEKHFQAWVLRLGTLHGVSDRMRFDLMVNTMTRDAVRTGVVKVFGGKQRRPLLSVWDAAQAIVTLATSERNNIPRGVYNLATDNYSATEVAALISDVTRAEVQVLDFPSEDRRDYAVSCSKINNVLGPGFSFISTCHTIKDSVQDIAALLLSGRLRDPDEDVYHNANALRRKNG